MDNRGFEEVGGYRFCICRPAKTRARKSAKWHFPVVLFVSIGALLVASKWAVTETEKGNFIPARLVAGGLLVAFCLSYVLAFVVALAQKHKPAIRPEEPAGFPNHIACEVQILRADKYFLSSIGWLGLDGDLLTFWGDTFDFALRPRDFHRSFDFGKFGKCRPARVSTLKGLVRTSIKLNPIWEGKSGSSKRDAQLAIQELLGRWRRAAVSDRQSMFPPLTPHLQPVNRSARRKVFGALAVVSMLFALIGLLVHWMFRDYLVQKDPLALMLAMSLIPFTFILAIWGSRLEYRATRRIVEKAKQAGRVELV